MKNRPLVASSKTHSRRIVCCSSCGRRRAAGRRDAIHRRRRVDLAAGRPNTPARSRHRPATRRPPARRRRPTVATRDAGRRSTSAPPPSSTVDSGALMTQSVRKLTTSAANEIAHEPAASPPLATANGLVCCVHALGAQRSLQTSAVTQR